MAATGGHGSANCQSARRPASASAYDVPVPERFQVDLRGVVELLSHHLYSSPRVYLRELAQNGVDAVAARRQDDPASSRDPRPDVLFVVRPDGVLDCWDSGSGLTPAQLEQFLSTIGSSSKRDELGFQREHLLGQFGIGLLSAFMVTDAIEVVSRSAERRAPVVRWQGSSDGTYTTGTVGRTRRLDPERRGWLEQGPGTCVRLVGAPGGSWTGERQVLDLAREYLSYLPHRIVVRTPDGTDHQIAPTEPPWRSTGSEQRRRAGDAVGLRPFALVPLTVPEAGLEGVAVVSDRPLDGRTGHHVYLRGMLVGTDVAGVAPDWAVFCRCVVNTSRLRPTASREALYDDDLAEDVRTAIGAQLMRWLRRLAEADPQRMASFLQVHHLGLKAAALHDAEVRALLLPLLPFESTHGHLPLAELTALGGDGATVRFVASVDDYRQVSPVARAQGLPVVNAGYVYEAELLRAWAAERDEPLSEMSPGDLELNLDHVDDATALAARPFVQAAEESLALADVAVQLRHFVPESVPALLLDDAASRRGRDLHRVREGVADDAITRLLESVAPSGDLRPRLALNHAHPQVRRLVALSDPAQVGLATRALYVRALLAGNRPLRPVDAALVESAFDELVGLVAGTTPQDTEETT